MINRIFIFIFIIASIESLGCETKKLKRKDNNNDSLGDYWNAPIPAKRARKDMSAYHMALGKKEDSKLRKEYKKAEGEFQNRNFGGAGKRYHELYNALTLTNAEHDFRNEELAEIFEGLALCSSDKGFTNKELGHRLALTALKRASKLELGKNKLEAIQFTKQAIEQQYERRRDEESLRVPTKF